MQPRPLRSSIPSRSAPLEPEGCCQLIGGAPQGGQESIMSPSVSIQTVSVFTSLLVKITVTRMQEQRLFT